MASTTVESAAHVAILDSPLHRARVHERGICVFGGSQSVLSAGGAPAIMDRFGGLGGFQAWDMDLTKGASCIDDAPVPMASAKVASVRRNDSTLNDE